MKIALVDSLSEPRYVWKLARRLSDRAEVTVLQSIHPSFAEPKGFDVVGFGEIPNIHFAERIHYWLADHRPDVVQAFSDGYPLLIEQLFGGTPTVIRYESDVLSKKVEQKVEISRGRIWTRHLMEMKCIQNAEIVMSSRRSFLESASAISPKMNFVRGNLKQVPMDAVENKTPDETVEGIVAWGDTKYLEQVQREFTSQSVFICDSEETAKRHYSGAALVMILQDEPVSDESLLEAMGYGCPVLCFEEDSPERMRWPLLRLGAPDSFDLITLTKVISSAMPETAEYLAYRRDVQEFVDRYGWKNLLDSHMAVYEDAVLESLRKGRVRGW